MEGRADAGGAATPEGRAAAGARDMSNHIISAILFVFLSLPPSFTLCQTGCFEEEDAGVTVGSRNSDKDQPFPVHHVCVYQPCRRARRAKR